MLKTPIIGVLLAGIAGVSSAATWADPEIRGWVTELELPDLAEDRRAAILNELAAAAGGELIEERTAEAIFALAEFQSSGRPPGSKSETNILSRMITLYPDDPRLVHVLRRLARSQLDANERYPAHFTMTRLLAHPQGGSTPELQIRGAANAVAVGDMQSALDWTAALERWELSGDLELSGWRARLAAAQSLGRHTDAVAALDRLEESGVDHLSSDAVAMLAAARTEVAAGRREAADTRYRDFVNIHTRAPQRPVAMLEHAELLAQLQRPQAARRVLQWLMDAHEGTEEADTAAVLDVEWHPDLSPAQRAVAYREVAIRARGEAAAVSACENLLELLIAEGQPLEAVSTLAWMTSNTRGFPAIAARRSLMTGAEAAIRLLASREDVVGVAAAATAIRAVGLPVPAGLKTTVASARRALGMEVADPRVERAGALAGEARWDEVNRVLAHVDRERLDDPDHTSTTVLAAEALWHLGQDDAARAMIESTLEKRELSPSSGRRLVVLRGDIAFARGERSTACRDYRDAAALRASPYVADQLAHCGSSDSESSGAAP